MQDKNYKIVIPNCFYSQFMAKKTLITKLTSCLKTSLLQVSCLGLATTALFTPKKEPCASITGIKMKLI